MITSTSLAGQGTWRRPCPRTGVARWPRNREWRANERSSHVRQLANLAPPVNGGSRPTMQTSPFRDQLSQWQSGPECQPAGRTSAITGGPRARAAAEGRPSARRSPPVERRRGGEAARRPRSPRWHDRPDERSRRLACPRRGIGSRPEARRANRRPPARSPPHLRRRRRYRDPRRGAEEEQRVARTPRERAGGPFTPARTHFPTSRSSSAMNASVPSDLSMKFFELTAKLS